MRLPIHAEIIIINLASRRRQTMIAALGITFGIGFYIAMISFMNGVNDLVENLMLSATPHIRMYNDIRPDTMPLSAGAMDADRHIMVHSVKAPDRQKNIRNAPEILLRLRNDPQVLGAAPRAITQAYFNYGTTEFPGTILGVDLLEENKLFDLNSKMTAGSVEQVISMENGIMLGGGLADKLGIVPGNSIPVTLPTGTRLYLTVAGIFRMGQALTDNSQAYASLHTVQKMLRRDNRYITDIYVKLFDKDSAPAKAAEYRNRFACIAEDWQTFNASILVSFTLRNVLTYAVAVSLLSVAGFGIYNIMTMMMFEKLKDIAILKALGFESFDIRIIFLGQAMALGMLGCILGMLLGLIMSVGISYIPYKNEFLPGMTALPVSFSIVHYITATVFSLLAAGLAGYFPARRAAGVDPVQIIRG